jgi:hypothetical protein
MFTSLQQLKNDVVRIFFPHHLPIDAQAAKGLSQEALKAIIWLFQLVIAASLVNGATNFIIDPKTHELRTKFSSGEIMSIAVFFTLTLLFAHGAIMYLNRLYGSGFTGQRWKPFLDFAFLYIQALVLFIACQSVHQLFSPFPAPAAFGEWLQVFLIIDILWCVFVCSIHLSERAATWRFIITNSVIFVIVFFLLRDTNWYGIALATIGVRNIVSYILSYISLFPAAY